MSIQDFMLRRGSQSIALNQDADIWELSCRKFAFQNDQTNLRLFSLLIKFRHNIWRPQHRKAVPKSTIRVEELWHVVKELRCKISGSLASCFSKKKPWVFSRVESHSPSLSFSLPAHLYADDPSNAPSSALRPLKHQISEDFPWLVACGMRI